MSRYRQQRGGGLLSGIGRNISQYIPEPENSTNNATGRNVEGPPPPLPGLAELVELLTIMGAAPAGVRPPINPELIETIKNSPLQPVIKVLQPIWKKLGTAENPAEQSQRPEANQPSQPTSTPGPDPSSTQQPTPPVAPDGTEVKASATASEKQFEAGDTKVSQMSAKLDPAFNEILQGINKLQVGLLGDVKAEKTRLETRVNELEKEVKNLQDVINDTRTELLPLEVASKIALKGTLSEDADKASTRGGATNAPGNVVQTAKRVRTNTLELIAKCWALFTFINRDPTPGSNAPDIGTEGEWGRCAEHLRASNTRLRSAIEEKEESAQKLQFFGFVVDQIRKGRYTEKEWTSEINGKDFAPLIENSPDGFASIRLLAQDVSRLTEMTAPVLPIAPVYGIPPVYGTPPATPAANAMAFQTPTIPMANAGVSITKPTTGGTRPRGRGNASTNQSSAATSSLASLLSS